MANSWNPEKQWSVKKDAGDKLHAETQRVMRRDNVKYKEAFAVVKEANPLTFSAYHTGIRTAPHEYRLAESDKRMIELQNDPDQVKSLAGSILNHHAMQLAGSNQMGYPNQVNPERFGSAMRTLMGQFPDLATAYNSGFIASDNWALLSTLLPSCSTEIKNRFGVDPYNLRSGNYSRDGARRYDNQGNEYRTYVR